MTSDDGEMKSMDHVRFPPHPIGEAGVRATEELRKSLVRDGYLRDEPGQKKDFNTDEEFRNLLDAYRNSSSTWRQKLILEVIADLKGRP